MYRMVFFAWILCNVVFAQTVVRGPYLQMGSSTSVVIRWRTSTATDTKVLYGTDLNNLNQFVQDATSVTNHEIKIDNLQPNTKYYYSFGTVANPTIGQGDATYYFKTLPPTGTAQKLRLWVIGDMGNNSQEQRDVRDAFTSTQVNDNVNHIDAWLLLGDNAYESGTDNEYQQTFFDIYPSILKNTFLYPCAGNHDYANNPFSNNPPYFDIFTLPTNGEIGGHPSGTERYYSYNIGNVHFISLDSFRESRSSTGNMANWLRQDLMNNQQKFTIVYMHYPPYTKGSHDSDSFIDFQCGEIRSNIVPILEDYGVDLVLCGHSHCYERSYFIDEHYGNSSTFDPNTMRLDSTGGHYPAQCPYRKIHGPHQGTVYAVVGCSGKLSSTGTLDHPVMYFDTKQHHGSMILDIEGDQLSAKFINKSQAVLDSFTIFKRNTNTFIHSINAGDSITLKAGWYNGGFTWNSGQNTRTITVAPSQNTTYIVQSANSCLIDTHFVMVNTTLTQQSLPSEWKVFPNPAQNSLYVFADRPLYLNIYNTLGQKIPITYQENMPHQYQCQLNNLSAGAYILVLEEKNTKALYSYRFVKE